MIFYNGEFKAEAAPQGNAITLADDGSNYGDGCKVRLQQIGPWLLAVDNAGCGGAGVSFTGLYRARSREDLNLPPPWRDRACSGRDFARLVLRAVSKTGASPDIWGHYMLSRRNMMVGAVSILSLAGTQIAMAQDAKVSLFKVVTRQGRDHHRPVRRMS